MNENAFDLNQAIILGLLLSFTVIIYNIYFPGNPKDYDFNKNDNDGVEKETIDGSIGNGEEIFNKLRAKQNLNNKLESDPNTDSLIEIYYIVKVFITLSFVLFVLYAINVLTKGDFGRVLLGFFPTEMESIGLADYLIMFR